MVHADASNFAPNMSKAQVYTQVIEQAEALFAGQRNWVCNLSQASSLLWHALRSLPSPSNSVNWAGFYVLDPSIKLLSSDPQTKRRLILGPFHGKVGCQTIMFGKGVCGTAALRGESVLVEDVDVWEGHIACDGETGSEIVVPIFDLRRNGSAGVVGVIDIDCKEKRAFDEVDREWLKALATLLGMACDWS